MTNAICRLCDLDCEICSCVPAPVSLSKRGRALFPACPAHYLLDQFDPQDDRRGTRA